MPARIARTLLRLLVLALISLCGVTSGTTRAGAGLVQASAICNESGTLTANAIWGADCVHVISTNVRVSSAVTLTLQPGTIVKLGHGNRESTLVVNGSLVAQGTSSAPVIFTSLKDDTYGGDTNGDGNASSPAPGDWTAIMVNGSDGSSASASFDYAIVKYAGSRPWEQCPGPHGAIWPAPENESTLYVTRTGSIWCDRAILPVHGSTVSGAGGR